ncbi:hypothetical protein Cs7R123_54170 [Catellatospora sp. TT07R-123]|uniref:ABC transporter substrate-binding protein n=1 Tax=Catellatospora sp. TT07R-123 TaxID=2733863 RepID=UPI001B1541FC|nr:ABC transporter substrate-binding protein [Catellatospora sp. TT07R-123]GHJ48075.1 hypothetical protein Cs7R123_54170 [Catellatospora sp. TT07R-123]
MSRRLTRRTALISALGLAAAPLLPGRAAAALAPLRLGLLTSPADNQLLFGVQQRAAALGGGGAHGMATPIELLTQDVGQTATSAREAVSLLLDRGVHGIVGPAAGWLGEAAAAEADRACTPIVLPAPGAAPELAYAFRSAPTDAQIHRALFTAMTGAGQRAAGVLRLAPRDTPALRDTVAAEAAARGAWVAATELLPADAAGLADRIAALLAATPDALLLDLPAALAAQAVTAARAASWTGPVFTTPDAVQPAFGQLAGPAAEGVRAVSPWLPVAAEAPEALPQLTAVRRFAERLAGAGGPADPLAGYAADAVTLLNQAFLGHRDRRTAREQLESTCCIGVTGIYNMMADDHVGLAPEALIPVTAHDGGWTTAAAPPAATPPAPTQTAEPTQDH